MKGGYPTNAEQPTRVKPKAGFNCSESAHKFFARHSKLTCLAGYNSAPFCLALKLLLRYLPRHFLLLTLFGLCSQTASAENTGVVFGSYLNRLYAYEKRHEIENEMGINTVVLAVDIGGSEHYRVVGIVNGYKHALEITQLARRNDIQAWVLRLSKTSYSSEVLLEPAPKSP